MGGGLWGSSRWRRITDTTGGLVRKARIFISPPRPRFARCPGRAEGALRRCVRGARPKGCVRGSQAVRAGRGHRLEAAGADSRSRCRAHRLQVCRWPPQLGATWRSARALRGIGSCGCAGAGQTWRVVREAEWEKAGSRCVRLPSVWETDREAERPVSPGPQPPWAHGAAPGRTAAWHDPPAVGAP